MQLTVICHREGGMFRGGVRHPRLAEHLATAFTPDQLREMLAERDLTVVVGRPLSPLDIAQIEDARAAAAKEAAREKTAAEGKPAAGRAR